MTFIKVAESLFYILLNLFFGMSGTHQKDAGGSGLCLRAFGMIMGDTGLFACSFKDGKPIRQGLIRMAEPFRPVGAG